MKKTLTILLCVASLTGCYNIRNYNNSHYTNTLHPHMYPDDSHMQTLPTAPIVVCPVYIPLPNNQTPDIPIEDIKAVARDDKRVIKLLTEYIREIRSYIADRKKQESTLYEQYLQQCRPLK